MIKNLLNAAVISLACSVASFANASVIALTNESQIATSYLNTFEGAMNTGPVTFQQGQLFTAAGAANGVTPSGTMGLLSQTFPQAIIANLANPFYAVGLYFGNDDRCCATGFSALLEVFNGATLLGSVSVLANMNDNADQFIGLSSTTAFDTVKISYGNVSLYTYIDDFRLGEPGNVSVPEPSTLLLLALGLLGLGYTRRKSA